MHIRLTFMVINFIITTLPRPLLHVWPIHYATMQNPRVVMSSATVASLVSIRNRVVTRQRPQQRCLRSFQIRPSTHQCQWGNDLPKRRQTHVRSHPPPSSRQGGRTHLAGHRPMRATCHVGNGFEWILFWNASLEVFVLISSTKS